MLPFKGANLTFCPLLSMASCWLIRAATFLRLTTHACEMFGLYVLRTVFPNRGVLVPEHQRRAHVYHRKGYNLAPTFEQRTKGVRLVYKTTGKGDLTAKKIDDPTSLKDAEVLGEFESATVCATDRSNVHGTLGHGNIPRIIGHEACFRVVESKHSSVPIGSYILKLDRRMRVAR